MNHMTMTLLETAKTVRLGHIPKPRKLKPVSPEEAELLFAYLKDDVLGTQVTRTLGIPRGSLFMWTTRMILRLYAHGRISIKENKDSKKP